MYHVYPDPEMPWLLFVLLLVQVQRQAAANALLQIEAVEEGTRGLFTKVESPARKRLERMAGVIEAPAIQVGNIGVSG